MFCNKCGENVPDGYEFCMKCGTKIDIDKLEVPLPIENSVPITKKINKKAFIPAIGIVLLVIIVVAFIYGVNDGEENNGYFANIPWGIDAKTLQKKVDKAFNCKSVIEKDAVMTSIENYDGMQGVTALPIWNCEDNGTLNEVNIMLSVGDDSRYTCKEIEDKLVEKYNKLFGNAYKDNVSYHWTTKNSKILLGKLSNKYVLLSFKK